jgi:hypothetical protein
MMIQIAWSSAIITQTHPGKHDAQSECVRAGHELSRAHELLLLNIELLACQQHNRRIRDADN